MATENNESVPVPVPPPATVVADAAPAPTEAPAPAAALSAPAELTTAAAPASTEAATAPAPEPEATPAPAPAPTAAAATPTESAAPAPEPEVTPVVAGEPPSVPEEKETAEVAETKPAQEETKATDEVSAPEAAAPAAVVAAEASTAKEDEPKKEETEQEETEQEEPEEQNDLTRKFTAEEWKAVKELRSQLPDIFVKAYPDKSPAPTSITLWGVPLSTEPNAKASVILVKFARARNLVVKDSVEMLISTLKWRDEIKIDEVLKEEFDPKVFGTLGKVYGKDKDGHPVTYNLYGEIKDMKAVFGDIQKFIRWRVQFMEQSIELLDFETVDQMVQIHDYEGVSITSRDASQKAAAKEATNIFQAHYPEFLSRKFFVNVPTLLTWVFWLFKPLISAATLAKMTVVGTGAKTIGAELSPVIPRSELPKRYGGEAEAF